MLRKILTSSRYVIAIAVLGTFLASIACLLIGGVQTVVILVHGFEEGLLHNNTKEMVVELFELVDFFLVGVVFYIMSLGLYELFIDDRLELPDWLVIHDLDDLKEKMTNGIVVVMVVSFLGTLLQWDGEANLIPLSISIAVIIGALTIFQLVHHRKNSH